jgi:hypothetical protein
MTCDQSFVALGFAFEQRDGDVVVADGDSISEVKLSTQTEHAREPFWTSGWTAGTKDER